MRGTLVSAAAGIMLAALVGSPACAQTAPDVLSDEQKRFVKFNSVSTLYHEFGHALIHTMRLPILAREEDAADVLNVILMDHLNDGAYADMIASETAKYYLLEDKAREAGGYSYNFSGDHAPYIRRHYNVLCLHYGANPKVRQPFLAKFVVPNELLSTCEYRRSEANRGWDWVLRQIEHGRGGYPSLQFFEDNQPSSEAETVARDALRAEVQYMADQFTLPVPIGVRFMDCDRDANAYYYPDTNEIVFCREYAGAILDLLQYQP